MRTLNRRQQLAALLLTIVALIFISLDFAGGSLRGARGGTTGALGSLYRGTDGVLGPVRRFIQGVPDVSSNRATIARLQAQNDQLRRQITSAQVDQSTAAQLKTLQLQANTDDFSVQPARVIATGPGSGFQWTVTVDAGSNDHVQAGQTVTNGVGVVGRVLSVYAGTSTVLLISDPASAVGVRDVRSGALLLATGSGASGLRATGVAQTGVKDVEVGDEVLSGPAGSTTYVPNIAVGIVTAIHGSSVTVAPTAAQTGLDLLGIVALPVAGVERPALSPVTG
jgi:rod shape-determining protein MreC